MAIGMRLWLFALLSLFSWRPRPAHGALHILNWNVQYANVTRLCHTKALVSVNGQFPGPTVSVSEGDQVQITVTNSVSYNMSIHWHGIRQLTTGWADGPAYITQCPIQPGRSYTYSFQIIAQRGTLWWHAHISWQRATVHGAFVISPLPTLPLPFPLPSYEILIILGEWWNANTQDVIANALRTGLGSQVSDAITINGQPGALYNCSLAGTQVFTVLPGLTYMLRIVNAALNLHLFVALNRHVLTVVEADAGYTQPYQTETVVISPGQTTNVLFTANQLPGLYVLAATVFSPPDKNVIAFPGTPTTAIIQYANAPPSSATFTAASVQAGLPTFPAYNDVAYVAHFTQSLRGLPFSDGFYYFGVPQTVDEDFLFTIGFATQPCSTCVLPERFVAAMNNVTLVLPETSILQAYYNNISGVYQTDFPEDPFFQYNYTGVQLPNLQSELGTKVRVLDFGITVQIVFQDTANLLFESHPIHLHGQNFYIVGTGFGNYDPTTDPANFNLVNPPSRNTIAVPSGGWAAIRFQTTNPGVWYMHCHIELHTSWGMAMAFIVKNGPLPSQQLEPPPSDLPAC